MITKDCTTGGAVDLAGFVSLAAETGTNLAPETATGNISGRRVRGTNATLGADEESLELTMGRPGTQRAAASKGLDRTLLKRAVTILGSFDSEDIVAVQLDMDALRGLVLELWESAESATQDHQDILALIEEAVLSVDSLTEDQVSVLREGFRDLEKPVLGPVHVDVIRGRLIRQGFSPLALLSELEDHGDS